jgi:hypothetical protein
VRLKLTVKNSFYADLRAMLSDCRRSRIRRQRDISEIPNISQPAGREFNENCKRC